MRELSMHILDLAQNSISADSCRIEIEVNANTHADKLTISIRDDGRGMQPEFLSKVRDPFVTTRKTRKVGLGIPMFTQAARACDGDVRIESVLGIGTTIIGTFKLQHIDRVPLGDIASTLITLIAANPGIRIRYIQRVDDKEFILDTNEVKAQLDGVPINENSVLKWLSEYIKENTSGDLNIV